ncbi:MAG: hypothetical protein E4G99_05365 [Anaerolineales bacterium]|nr:MAG: hypothetical protein E4G99_05365 [Anaerolineales bacterium]
MSAFMLTDGTDWRPWLYLLLGLIIAGVVLSSLLLIWVLGRVRRIDLPAGADAITALQQTPFVVVLLLDLLDLGLDIFSVPLTWPLLGRLGLAPLRGVTVIEGLIPGTQLVPTMTFAWLFARWLGRRRREGGI